jgi:YHS domain-containing protein
MATQTDPVCGMQVDDQTAAGRSEYQGQTYYFCAAGCKRTFDENPDQYAGTSSEGEGGGRSR